MVLIVVLAGATTFTFCALKRGEEMRLKQPVKEFLLTTKQDMRDGYAFLGLDFAEIVSYEEFQTELLGQDFQAYNRYDFQTVETGKAFDRPNEAHIVVYLGGEDVLPKVMEFLLVKNVDQWEISAFGF